MKKYELFLLLLIVFLGGFLRFYKIDKNPPGLYVDEVSIGYNAYKILNTGQDEYGKKFPIFFKAFGEYKMPVYIYSTAMSIAVFGKNEFAIRFPSALSGTLTVFIFYLLLRKILELEKSKISMKIGDWKFKIPLVASSLLAVSSWHIHFSRGGFEVTFGAFLFILGSYIFLLFWESKRLLNLLLSIFCFALTIYTYNVFRILSPIVWIILSMFILKNKNINNRHVFISEIYFLILCSPIIVFSFTAEGASRFLSTSAFSEYPTQNLIQKLFIYPMVFVKDYLSFFSFDFLFSNGDGNGRHQLPGFGQLFRWQIPFLFLGIIWLIKEKKSILKFVTFFLLFLAPVPAALTRPSPHSLRSLLIVLPLTILITIGILHALKMARKRVIVLTISILFIAGYEFSLFLHGYYYHYPIVNALDWGAANKETIQKIVKYKKDYDFIAVDSRFISSSIYFRFYDDSLKYSYIDKTWEKPDNLKNKRVLYIALYDRKSPHTNVFDQAYLPGPRKDIYTQFLNL